jgi:ubiquinone/menaquinone biosynthesis C-methylase UbiE
MSQETEIYTKVQSSFGPNAHAYTVSKTHADSAILARLVAKVGPHPTDKMLDIGTGAGHTAIAFAPAVASVVALDLTPEMLTEVQRNAAAKGINNLTVKLGPAEALPFADGEFDIVSCRLTTHHFANLPQAVREMGRVLKVGGKLVISDTTVPLDAELDQQINEIEILRDPSHVRNYNSSEWRELVEQEAHMQVVDLEANYYDEGDKLDFDNWTQRLHTTPANVTKLRQIFQQASPALQSALQIEINGDKIDFALPRITLVAVK